MKIQRLALAATAMALFAASVNVLSADVPKDTVTKADTASIGIGESSTLDDLLAYAALNSPEMEAAFYRWKASLETIQPAGTLPDPRITYAYYIRNVETRVGPQRHSIGIAQTFPWPGVRDLRKESAETDALRLEKDYEKIKRKVFFSVRLPYYEYWFAQRAETIAREKLGLLQTIGAVAARKYESGKGSFADLLRIQSETAQTEELIESLKDARKSSAVSLNSALGRLAGDPLPEESDLPEYRAIPPADSLYASIASGNPEISAFAELIKKEELAAELAYKKMYPDLTLGLSYIETGEARMPGVSDSGKDPLMATLSFNIPIRRDSYRAMGRESELRGESLAKTREARINELSAMLAKAIANVRVSDRKAMLYSGQLIPRSSKSLDISIRRYESGEGSFAEVIDTLRIILEQNVAYERVKADRARYAAEIELIAGDTVIPVNSLVTTAKGGD